MSDSLNPDELDPHIRRIRGLNYDDIRFLERLKAVMDRAGEIWP